MLNSNQIQCILIGNEQILSHVPPNTVIKIYEEVISPSSHVKNLGMYMDRFMLFDKHKNKVTQKVTGTLMSLSRVRATLDKSK